MSIQTFAAVFLVFARVGAMLAIMPMFSMPDFPVKLRVSLSVMIAFLLAPFLPVVVALDQMPLWSMAGLLATEVSVGLLLGFICALGFYALDAAGSIMATEMGLTMSSEFNQFSKAQTPIIGTALTWLAIMIWFSLDLHHWMIAAVQRSYALVPVGGGHLSELLLKQVVQKTAATFRLAVEMSAPIIGVSFILSLVFSILGRAVPQMNVFSESFPIRTLVGLMVFGSTILLMAQHIITWLQHLPEDALQVIQLVGAG